MTRSESVRVRRPSRRVLAALPERVVRFLYVAATHAGVRAALGAGGFRPSDHAEGIRLLTALCAWSDEGTDPEELRAAREAFDDLARWLAAHRTRFEIALERLCPDELGVFATLPSAPEAAPVAVSTLLSRLSDLERRAARDPSAARALETLSVRGLDPAERARLAELAHRAQQSPKPESSGPTRDPRHRELDDLYRWFRDWSHTAHAVIARKDYLVALGLADRKKTQQPESAATESELDTGEL